MDTDSTATSIVNLTALAQTYASSGPAWSYRQPDADLNVNLIVWNPGEGVGEHVNDEVNMLLVGIAGRGIIEVEGRKQTLHAGQAMIVPKGKRRAVHTAGERFAYLTCHQRRPGLWPRHHAREG